MCVCDGWMEWAPNTKWAHMFAIVKFGTHRNAWGLVVRVWGSVWALSMRENAQVAEISG